MYSNQSKGCFQKVASAKENLCRVHLDTKLKNQFVDTELSSHLRDKIKKGKTYCIQVLDDGTKCGKKATQGKNFEFCFHHGSMNLKCEYRGKVSEGSVAIWMGLSNVFCFLKSPCACILFLVVGFSSF